MGLLEVWLAFNGFFRMVSRFGCSAVCFFLFVMDIFYIHSKKLPWWLLCPKAKRRRAWPLLGHIKMCAESAPTAAPPRGGKQGHKPVTFYFKLWMSIFLLELGDPVFCFSWYIPAIWLVGMIIRCVYTGINLYSTALFRRVENKRPIFTTEIFTIN